jgi:hypothetical protein
MVKRARRVNAVDGAVESLKVLMAVSVRMPACPRLRMLLVPRSAPSMATVTDGAARQVSDGLLTAAILRQTFGNCGRSLSGRWAYRHPLPQFGTGYSALTISERVRGRDLGPATIPLGEC